MSHLKKKLLMLLVVTFVASYIGAAKAQAETYYFKSLAGLVLDTNNIGPFAVEDYHNIELNMYGVDREVVFSNVEPATQEMTIVLSTGNPEIILDDIEIELSNYTDGDVVADIAIEKISASQRKLTFTQGSTLGDKTIFISAVIGTKTYNKKSTTAKLMDIPCAGCFATSWTVGTGEEITFPTSGEYSYDINVNWGDGNNETFNETGGTDKLKHTYAMAGDYQVKITGTFPAMDTQSSDFPVQMQSVDNLGDVGWRDFYSAFENSKIKTFTAGYTDTTQVLDMSYMFAGIMNLKSIDFTKFYTGNVANMSYMFYSAISLKNINFANFDTSSVVNMNAMFYEANSLTGLNLSSFDTSKVVSMGYMFRNATGLTTLNISNFDTSSVNNMGCIFYGLRGLSSLDVSHFDTSKVNNMGYMFLGASGLNSLDVSHFDTSSVVNMNAMFHSMSNLAELNLSSFDTSKVTNMAQMFYNTDGLSSLDISYFNTSNVTDMRNMFAYADGLSSLDLSTLDVSSVVDMSQIFQSMSNLTELDISNWDMNLVNNADGMLSSSNSLNSITYNKELVTSSTYGGLLNKISGQASAGDTGIVNDITFNNGYNDCGTNITCNDAHNYLESNKNWIFTNAIDLIDVVGDADFTFTNDIKELELVLSTNASSAGLDLANVDVSILGYGDGGVIGTATIETISSSVRKITFTKGSRIDSENINIIFKLNNEIIAQKSLIATIDSLSEACSDCFSTTWRVASGDTISFPTSSNYTYNANMDWGDGSATESFTGTGGGDSLNHTYAIEGSYQIRITGTFPAMDNNIDEFPTQMISVDNLGAVSWVNFYKAFKRSSIKSFTAGVTDTSNVINMYGMFYEASSLTKLNISSFDTSSVTTMSSMFYNAGGLTSLDLSSFDTSKVTNMANMFCGANSLTELDVSNFDTSSVADMKYMFRYTSSLTELDVSGFDTSNVLAINAMFGDTDNLTTLDLSSFNTSSVTDMYGLFYNARKLTSINFGEDFNTSNVTSMAYMFQGAINLIALDVSSFNTSKTEYMYGMFYGTKSLTSLDLSSFDTSNVISMYYMFYNANKLTSINFGENFDTFNVINMDSMFKNTDTLSSLDLSKFETSKVDNMEQMFYSMDNLTELNLSGWDVHNVAKTSQMFNATNNLSDITYNTDMTSTQYGTFMSKISGELGGLLDSYASNDVNFTVGTNTCDAGDTTCSGAATYLSDTKNWTFTQ